MTTLDDLATTDILLVASDFDGTLAGFSSELMSVPINERSMSALERLSRMPRTTVAIVSGRHLDGLRQVAHAPDSIILVGSHGGESDDQLAPMTPAQQQAMDKVRVDLEKLTADYPGSWVEHKPLHAVLHTRLLGDDGLEADITQRARDLAAPELFATQGKHILEFSAVDVTKGTWIAAARENYHATAVLFLGDDTTDENGFRVLGPGDLGVKVGPGDTAATERCDTLDDVADFLTALAEARQAHLAS